MAYGCAWLCVADARGTPSGRSDANALGHANRRCLFVTIAVEYPGMAIVRITRKDTALLVGSRSTAVRCIKGQAMRQRFGPRRCRLWETVPSEAFTLAVQLDGTMVPMKNGVRTVNAMRRSTKTSLPRAIQQVLRGTGREQQDPASVQVFADHPRSPRARHRTPNHGIPHHPCLQHCRTITAIPMHTISPLRD